MRLRKITSSILAVSVLFSSISPGISLVHAANPSSATANVVGGYRFLTTTVDFGGVDTLATGDVVTLDFTTSSGGTITFTGSNDGGTNISFPGKDIGSIIVFPDNTSVEIPVTISGSISDSVGTVYFSGITKTFGAVRSSVYIPETIADNSNYQNYPLNVLLRGGVTFGDGDRILLDLVTRSGGLVYPMVDYTASGSDIGGTGAVFLVNLSTVPDDVLVSSGVLVNSGGTIIDQIEGGFTKTVILNTNTISIDHISLGDPAETFTGKISQNGLTVSLTGINFTPSTYNVYYNTGISNVLFFSGTYFNENLGVNLAGIPLELTGANLVIGGVDDSSNETLSNQFPIEFDTSSPVLHASINVGPVLTDLLGKKIIFGSGMATNGPWINLNTHSSRLIDAQSVSYLIDGNPVVLNSQCITGSNGIIIGNGYIPGQLQLNISGGYPCSTIKTFLGVTPINQETHTLTISANDNNGNAIIPVNIQWEFDNTITNCDGYGMCSASIMDATPSDNGGGNSGTGTVTPPWYTINERQDLAHKHYYHAGDLFSITYTGTSLGDELALYASGINEGTGAEEFDNHAQDFAFVLLGTGTTQSSSGIFDITIPSLFPIGNYVLQFSRLVGGVESSKFFVPKTYDYVNDGGFNVVTGILPPGMSGGGGGSGTGSPISVGQCSNVGGCGMGGTCCVGTEAVNSCSGMTNYNSPELHLDSAITMTDTSDFINLGNTSTGVQFITIGTGAYSETTCPTKNLGVTNTPGIWLQNTFSGSCSIRFSGTNEQYFIKYDSVNQKFISSYTDFISAPTTQTGIILSTTGSTSITSTQTGYTLDFTLSGATISSGITLTADLEGGTQLLHSTGTVILTPGQSTGSVLLDLGSTFSTFTGTTLNIHVMLFGSGKSYDLGSPYDSLSEYPITFVTDTGSSGGSGGGGGGLYNTGVISIVDNKTISISGSLDFSGSQSWERFDTYGPPSYYFFTESGSSTELARIQYNFFTGTSIVFANSMSGKTVQIWGDFTSVGCLQNPTNCTNIKLTTSGNGFNNGSFTFPGQASVQYQSGIILGSTGSTSITSTQTGYTLDFTLSGATISSGMTLTADLEGGGQFLHSTGTLVLTPGQSTGSVLLNLGSTFSTFTGTTLNIHVMLFGSGNSYNLGGPFDSLSEYPITFVTDTGSSGGGGGGGGGGGCGRNFLIPPVIEYTGSSLTSQNSISIYGTTDSCGPKVVSVYNNGVLLGTGLVSGDSTQTGSFNFNISLNENQNLITAKEGSGTGLSLDSNTISVTKDTTAPTVILNGSGVLNIEFGSNYTELGATYSDLVDGTGTISTISGTVSTGSVGTNFVQYIKVDNTGNIGSITRTVNIVDTIVPTATIVYSITGATNQDVTASLTGASESITGTLSHTFTSNGAYGFSFQDLQGNTSYLTGSVTWIDKTTPVISGKTAKNISQTGANVSFNFSEPNFSTGTGYVIVYTGSNIANLVETGILNLSFSGGIGNGNATLVNLAEATNYNYLINLTDSVGNTSSNTGTFTTVQAPIIMTGGVNTQTGSVALTGAAISTGSTLNLNGTTLTISSNSNDTSSITGSLSIVGTNISVTGSTSWNGILIPPTLIDNTTTESATSNEIGSGVTVTQTIKVGAEGASLIPSTSTGYFDVSFVVPGYSSGTVLDLYRSDDGATWTRVSPDGTCTLNISSVCSFRTNHLSYFAPVLDTTPDAFNFTAQTDKEISTSYESNTITVSGINTGSTISISGGQYKVGAGSYTGSTGTVNSGDTVMVKLTSSSSYSTPISTVLTIGGVSVSFSVTTKAQPVVVNNGGSGGGGGVSIDSCPSGDTSGSYYDGKCGSITASTGTVTGTGTNLIVTNTQSGIIVTTTTASGTTTTTTFTKPKVILNSLGDIKVSDVNNNWAKDYIYRLVARGVVNNSERYNPDNNLTRAEFLKIAMNAAGWKTTATGTNIFEDVPTDSWYAPYVSLALSKGIISDKNTNFRPNDTISRAEASKIIVGIFGTNIINSKTSFSDVDESSDLAKYIETAKNLGFLSGQVIDGKLKFRPNDSITRAEIAKIVVKAFNL